MIDAPRYLQGVFIMRDISQSSLSKRATAASATYTMQQVCGLFHISYSKLWEMVRADTFPVAPIQLGRSYRFPRAKVDALLGLDAHREGDVADAQ